MSTLKNAKGEYDKYLLFKATKEEYVASITTAEELKKVQKTLNNAAFYINHNKMPVGYGLVDALKAVENAKANLEVVAQTLRASGIKKDKIKKFYEYSAEEVAAMDIDALRRYGKTLSSYLCKNGMDDRYNKYYDVYTDALEVAQGKGTRIKETSIEEILNGKMTKAQMQDALRALISK